MLAEGNAEVADADAQVVELEDALDANLASAATRLGRCGFAWIHGRSRRRVNQLRFADVEAIVVDHQARAAVARRNLSCDAEGWEGDRCRLQDENLFARPAIGFLIVIRVPIEDDARTGHLQGIRDLDFQASDLDAELARYFEGITQIAAARNRAQGGEYVDIDIEGSQQASELGGNAAVGLRRAWRSGTGIAAEIEAGFVDANADGNHELAVLELRFDDAYRWANQGQRSEGDCVVRICSVLLST